jgi:hypothetical protein
MTLVRPTVTYICETLTPCVQDIHNLLVLKDKFKGKWTSSM